jgi:hypothetical protein
VNPLCLKSSEIIGTISAKPVGAGAAFAAVDSNGQPVFAADAHRDDGTRFIVNTGNRSGDSGRKGKGVRERDQSGLPLISRTVR